MTPSATSFPQIIATSHSYNRSLFHEIGAAIATEVRAFANVGNAGLTYWTPNLNIFRDPRWGRGQETPGEDPYLTGEYVSSYVPGLQVDESDPKHLKISACCKHYVAYSLEDYDSVDRHHFNANVTMQDMADTYLPAFEACASPARGAGSCIMCSYNSVAYHQNVLDHYNNPRNVGSMNKADPDVGTGLVGAPACGDVMKLQIKVGDDGTIEKAVFKTFGCGSAIASSSYATEILEGKKIEEAMHIKNTDIAQHLKLPPVKLHCSMLAEDAIKAAVTDYKKKKGTA